MKVKKLSKKQQKKLLDYAMENCKMVSFTENLDHWSEGNEAILKIIFGYDFLIPMRLLDEKAFENIEEIANRYKTDKKIQEISISEEWVKGRERLGLGLTKKDYEEDVKESIELSLMWYYFCYQIEKFLKENRKYLVFKRERFWTKKEKEGFLNLPEKKSVTYQLDLTKEVKEYIRKTNYDIYGWIWPYCIEDICFYDENGKIWLYSVAHERICDIYCKTDEEYKTLKKLGIHFWGEQQEYQMDEAQLITEFGEKSQEI